MSCITALEEIIITSGETILAAMSFISALEDGITLSISSAVCSPTGVTLGSTTISSGVVHFTVTSSTVGRYVITATVTTSDSQILKGRGNLRVVE